ncbi:MAG: hypothetical protein ABS69_15970 [Nitrosomonadales bacterium SCN 54-20]|nr:MAG: hypothetical protein ABS69_15970 [Nitrosomonadales bacterium SCN 54-20]
MISGPSAVCQVPLTSGAYGLCHGSSFLAYIEHMKHIQLIKHKDLLCQPESTLAKEVKQA